MKTTMLKVASAKEAKGALATFILEERAKGAGTLSVELQLPSVSARVARDLTSFMERVAPDVRFRLSARQATRPPTKTRSVRRGTSDTFTDMNQWLLKYLLLAPQTSGRPRSLRALAHETDTSLPTAQRFVHTFTTLGHLVRGADGFEVVRRAELLRLWLSSMDLVRDWRIPARTFFGTKRLLADLAKGVAAAKIEAALGGFAACDARGILHVVDPGAVEIHVDENASVIVWEQAERCDERDADVHLIPSSVFAASVFRPLRWEKKQRRDVLPIVDAIQMALDVWPVAARGGQEQARFIIANVLGWLDGD